MDFVHANQRALTYRSNIKQIPYDTQTIIHDENAMIYIYLDSGIFIYYVVIWILSFICCFWIVSWHEKKNDYGVNRPIFNITKNACLGVLQNN